MSGEVRPELTIDQVVDLVHAVAVIPSDDDSVSPILHAALAGLRTGGAVRRSERR